MSDCFGEQAQTLFARSAQYLGWGPQDFWRATPQELTNALSDPAGKPALMDRTTLSRLLEQDQNG